MAPEQNCVCHTHDSHDYWFCLLPQEFAEAQSRCAAKGLHLIQVSSAAEDGWIYDTAATLSFGEYFLGTTDATSPDDWAWLAGDQFWVGAANGTAAAYVNWMSGEPDGDGECAVVEEGLIWDDRSCAESHRYICEDGGGALPETYSCTANALPDCACLSYDGRDYLHCTRDRSWEVSRAFCESMGMHQVRIDDAPENEWLGTLTVESMLWTSGKEVAMNDWRWQDGTNDALVGRRNRKPAKWCVH